MRKMTFLQERSSSTDSINGDGSKVRQTARLTCRHYQRLNPRQNPPSKKPKKSYASSGSSSSSRSVRTRQMLSTGRTKILPSPGLPVRPFARQIPMTLSTSASLTTISIFTFGMSSTGTVFPPLNLRAIPFCAPPALSLRSRSSHRCRLPRVPSSRHRTSRAV